MRKSKVEIAADLIRSLDNIRMKKLDQFMKEIMKAQRFAQKLANLVLSARKGWQNLSSTEQYHES